MSKPLKPSQPMKLSSPEANPKSPPKAENPTAQNISPPHSTSNIELEHLQSLKLDSLTTAQAYYAGHDPAGMVLGTAEVSGGYVLSRDEFYQQVFCGLHQIGGAMTGLQSLPVKPDEEQAARAASDALYDTSEETPYLRFLIEPSNKWLQRGFCLFAYAAPKLKAVQAEIAAKKSQTVEHEGVV